MSRVERSKAGADKTGRQPTRDQIAATRRFNRFYTGRIGVLEEGLLKSGFSLTEARVLYELAHRQTPTSTALCRDLALDPGYLSRILARFAERRLTTRSRSATDGRERPIALTSAGRKAFAALDRASDRQIAALLAGLPDGRRRELIAAMDRIESILEGGNSAAGTEAILRQPRPGDMGWVIHRHAALYAEEYGFDTSFEHLVAEIVAGFVKHHDPNRERVWIADLNGAVAGSIFLVRESDMLARLRLLYVEPWARGHGIGARLVAACIDQARAFGYHRLTLWTQSNLLAARRIYQAAGFHLEREHAHHAFGQDLVEQDWSLAL